ncbi:hypothetical protein PIIN_07948 [Serendipita indica DSM 11827]|uniref:Uncharacterized protein n=1 Tax=Serendipita indica (strain DSM 11827) TaxID=1109443 RepID=G4TRQ1_SERID|nr:hypothetical protein PIIN_07948 [Serendipita indica DSM 11827]
MFISPTFVGRDPPLPIFVPPLYRPYPLPKRRHPPEELGDVRVRELYDEARDLSDEELELEERYGDLKNRGFNYLIPLGKTLTLREEQIDLQAASDSASEAPEQPEEASVENDAAPAEGGEGEEQDLDAELEDLDEGDGDEEEEDDSQEEDNSQEDEEEEDAMSE